MCIRDRFLSIPALFDYKSLEQKIEKKVESDFKINLDSVGKIKYRFFPFPHLVFEKSNLFFSHRKSSHKNFSKEGKTGRHISVIGLIS